MFAGVNWIAISALGTLGAAVFSAATAGIALWTAKILNTQWRANREDREREVHDRQGALLAAMREECRLAEYLCDSASFQGITLPTWHQHRAELIATDIALDTKVSDRANLGYSQIARLSSPSLTLGESTDFAEKAKACFMAGRIEAEKGLAKLGVSLPPDNE